MNDPSQMMNRSFGMWPPPQPAPADHPMGFPNSARPQPPFAAGPKPGRMNWKVKKAADKRMKAAAAAASAGGGPAVGGGMIPHGGNAGGAGGGMIPMGGGAGAAGGGVSGYNPPALTDLQFQNRVKARRFYPKKKFARFAPYAPRNTSSFIIRAKKSGGIASLVSPCPVTPAILPTPKFSPTREGLSDMVKEEWGVDGYGTMKGLIRLRSPNGSYEIRSGAAEEDEEEDDSSSESDVEEHLEVERRLDHDVSRFEMVYPGDEHGPPTAAYLLENRVDDQDTHIAQLEEENLTLKERLFLMEQDMRDLRRRLQVLENRGRTDGSNNNNNNNINNNDHNSEDNNSNNHNDDENAAAEAASDNEGGGDVSSEKSVGDCDESGGTPMHDLGERGGGDM